MPGSANYFASKTGYLVALVTTTTAAAAAAAAATTTVTTTAATTIVSWREYELHYYQDSSFVHVV